MNQTPPSRRIVVLGTGNFGTCLAQHLAEQGHSVTMWTRSAEVARSINTAQKNPKYLSMITLSNRISATEKVTADLLKDSDALLIAVPTQTVRQVLTDLKPLLPPSLLIICAAKGIEIGSQLLPVQIIKDTLGAKASNNAVFLSGPSFAAEIIMHEPTAVVVGSYDENRRLLAQEMFHAPHFRTYTSDDPIGLEVAGALKNVIAIASGACSGLGFQGNSRAALLTRGLAEITRIGIALGANQVTFTGLGGVGDLFLTCSSEKSRNFTVGYRLGRGEPLDKVLATVGSVAEGVATAKAAHSLVKQLGVAAPITEQVYQVLYEAKPIVQAVKDLLTRERKSETA